jgi:DNA-binding transcriptional regulator YiaG
MRRTFQDALLYITPIKKFRERLKCSQEDLARLVGVSVRTVQRWEKGIVRPSRLAR